MITVYIQIKKKYKAINKKVNKQIMKNNKFKKNLYIKNMKKFK